MAINGEVEKILRTLNIPAVKELITISDAIELINGALRKAYADARKTGNWQPYSTLKNIKESKIKELEKWKAQNR